MKIRPGLRVFLLSGYLVQILLIVLGIIIAWLLHRSSDDLEISEYFWGLPSPPSSSE